MKRLYTLLLAAIFAMPAMAESGTKLYDFDFYGFIRNDFYYDSRESVASCNELFYLYPLDERLDANGEDLNATSSSGFFSFVTRMGVKVAGPNVGRAKVSGNIEVDFGGYGNMNTLLRIRQANLSLDWESGSSLLIGQTWHPLFGSVMPFIANLSTGAPFQPFNRSPQLRYQYSTNGLKFTAAALCQLQYTSSGPVGSSNQYALNSCIPEFYAGVDYTSNGWSLGGGVDILNLKPRTESIVDGQIYKVDEMMTAVSGEVHLSYRSDKLYLAMKSLMASALDHTLLLGGYGVTGVSYKITGEQEYAPMHHSTSWINITYGKEWRPLLFVGYTKNLGASESFVAADNIYGLGTNIDQLLGANIGISYNKPHWSCVLEYSATTAWYGDVDLAAGGAVNSDHNVTNNRIAAIMTYLF